MKPKPEDTPETDEFIMWKTALTMSCAMAEFARKLERERDEARSLAEAHAANEDEWFRKYVNADKGRTEARREAEKYHGMYYDSKWPKQDLPWKQSTQGD